MLLLSDGVKSMEIESNDNFYADLGYIDADEMYKKHCIIIDIKKIIKQQKISQIRAAKIAGVSQSTLSRMLDDNFRSLPTNRIVECLIRLKEFYHESSPLGID